MTTCPCCGSRFEGDLEDGCASCGARAVGPPLARPARELPAYGRALSVGLAGALLSLTLITSTILALFEQTTLSLGFWKIVAAAETAVWRLKWVVFPLSVAALWASARVRRTLRRQPARFAGHRVARAGFALTALVVLSFITLIGVTIPERLRQRELALKAADEALVHATDRVLYAYRAQFNTLPASADDLRKLPDPDGSVRRVVDMLEEAGTYAPKADIAALPAAPSGRGRGRRGLRGLRMSNVSAKTSADDVSGEKLSFTNYELVLPGRDKLLNTEDDIWIRDGAIVDFPPSLIKQQPRMIPTRRTAGSTGVTNTP